MRIDAYNQINQIYQTTRKTKTATVSNVTAKDELYISNMGKDYQVARQAVAQSPDIREDKVASLKAGMEAGTYQVNGESFAEKLMAAYENIME